MNWLVSCTRCGISYVFQGGRDLPELCPGCEEKGKKEVKKFLEKEQKRKEIVSATTTGFEDRKVVKTLGFVSHEHIFGVALLKELDLAKFNGGIALSWAEKFKTGRDLSVRSILDESLEMGGNGVVGVDVLYRVLGTHNDMLMMLISAKGTAVVVE